MRKNTKVDKKKNAGASDAAGHYDMDGVSQTLDHDVIVSSDRTPDLDKKLEKHNFVNPAGKVKNRINDTDTSRHH